MRRLRDRSVACYRAFMVGYTRRFRGRYEEAIVDAFALELARVRALGSRSALAAFWALMTIDLVAGVIMTRGRDIYRRLAHDARVIRRSTGFTAALATLVIIPVWAWSRFATYATYTAAYASAVTLTFCVSALHAIVMWALARGVGAWYAVRRAHGRPLRYVTIRRASIVARVAEISAAAFIVAAITEARRNQHHAALIDPGISLPHTLGYWFFLAATLAAIVGLYFALGSWLRVRNVS